MRSVSVSIFVDSALENFSHADTDTLPASGRRDHPRPLLRRVGIAWASALVRNRSFSQQRRVALFRIRSKVFSVTQDSDVLKISEIKANRNAVLALAIEYRLI